MKHQHKHEFEFISCVLAGVQNPTPSGLQRVCIGCGYIESMIAGTMFSIYQKVVVENGLPTPGQDRFFDKTIERINKTSPPDGKNDDGSKTELTDKHDEKSN